MRALCLLALAAGWSVKARAADQDADSGFAPEQIEFFEREIRPILSTHCFECHSGDHREAGLALDSRAAVLRGSDYHKVVDLEKPEESRLMLAVRHAGGDQDIKNMPKSGEPLASAQIAALEHWISSGLPWPDEGEPLLPAADGGRDHWAFQPVSAVKVPPGEASHPVDTFVRRRLAQAGLEPAPQANRAVLARRLHLLLTGLPPTYEELQSFVTDERGDAIERRIDTLLDSPHFGEQWARHWMDVARYSDTKGYEAGGRERRFVYSYTYRDWLIRAFNEDLPYDRFLLYQLAADQLCGEGEGKADRRHLAAMGFLTLSKNGREELILDDRIDTTFRGTMALTVACARCHDHKFDPIPTADYYGLYGIFKNSVNPPSLPVIGEAEETPAYKAYLEEKAKLQAEVEAFLKPKLEALSEKHPDLAGQRDKLIAKLDRVDRRKMQDIQKKVDKFVADRQMEPARALTLVDREPVVAQPVFIRGDPKRRGDIAPRRFLTVFAGEEAPEYAAGSGRLELAHAITDSDNPLTARVMVNRVWMQLFGEGIVRTVSDFGTQGERPTHPELLDWLAGEFLRQGASVKELIRLLVTSETWQQSSDHPRAAAFAEKDAENRLLWRHHRRRLSFEEMRDATLLASGQLDPKLYGPSVKILEPGAPPRRSLYAFIDRQNLNPTFRTFDFANPQEHTGRRTRTTIPTQALFGLNSPFMQARASALVQREAVRAVEDPGARVEALYRCSLGRGPEAAERQLALSFVKSQSASATSRSNLQTLTEWQYGHAAWNEETASVEDFEPLGHWTGERWQAAEAYPLKGDRRSYLHVDGNGSMHPGDYGSHCVVLRWTAPEAITLSLRGKVERPNTGKGDGIRAFAFSSRVGVLGEVVVSEEKAAPLTVDKILLEAGESLDLVVHPLGNNAFDSVVWQPLLVEHDENGNEGRRWNFSDDFMGPGRLATPWENLGQALLMTNEFHFID